MNVCAWPYGEHWDVVIQMPGEEPYCMVHDDATMLPELTTGIVAGCTVCGKTTLTWFRDLPLHAECRRQWLLRQVPGERRGAYARRQGRTT